MKTDSCPKLVSGDYLIARNFQQGVLIVEVMLSIAIFSFAILGMIALQAKAVGFSSGADERNRAAILANDMVAIMWAQKTVSAGNLASDINNWQTRVRASLPPYNGAVTATVTNGVENGAATATITVTWISAGQKFGQHTYSTTVAMP